VITVLDDFGTGYSSLSYLDRFPIETLKIDRAFVSHLEAVAAPAPIVTAIVGMARALDVGTIAEGVETAEQAAALAALGCLRAQGYFFARPGPPEQIAQLVRDDTPLRTRAAEASAMAPPAPARMWAGLRAGVAQLRAPADIADYRRWLLAALLAPDAHAAKEVIVSALADQVSPDTIEVEIVGPAKVEIARLEELGELSEPEAELATDIANRLVQGPRPAHAATCAAVPPRA
jgi:hypothetical protein